MRYFHKLTENVPVLPIMAALARQPELWDQDNSRKEFDNSPHTQVSDILLRFGAKDGDQLEAWDSPLIHKLPGLKKLCLDTMGLVGGSRLGRVIITRVEPGSVIAPHADVLGEYSQYYSRYHLALQGMPGSMFTCGDETVQMLTGELWWFNAHAQHSVKNNSRDDRIHLLIDVRIDP